MDNKELISKIAILESRVDYLESEMSYVNDLLIKCGFPEGLVTLKATAEELLTEQEDSSFPYKFFNEN